MLLPRCPRLTFYEKVLLRMLGTTNSKLLIVFPSNNSWNLEFCYVRPIVYFLKLEEATQIRNSLPEVFCKKGVLRNFIKFAGKHLCHSLFFNKVACQSLFFNKVAGLRPAVWLKKRLWRRYFPVNFAKFLRIPFLTKHLRRLLLQIMEIVFEHFDLVLHFKINCGLC